MAMAMAMAEALAVGLTDPSEGFEVWGDFSFSSKWFLLQRRRISFVNSRVSDVTFDFQF